MSDTPSQDVERMEELAGPPVSADPGPPGEAFEAPAGAEDSEPDNDRARVDEAGGEAIAPEQGVEEALEEITSTLDAAVAGPAADDGLGDFDESDFEPGASCDWPATPGDAGDGETGGEIDEVESAEADDFVTPDESAERAGLVEEGEPSPEPSPESSAADEAGASGGGAGQADGAQAVGEGAAPRATAGERQPVGGVRGVIERARPVGRAGIRASVTSAKVSAKGAGVGWRFVRPRLRPGAEMVCRAVSWPLRFAPDRVRDMIGVAGAVTLLNALVMLVLVLILL